MEHRVEVKRGLKGDPKSVTIGFFTDTHLHHLNPRSRIDDYPNTILGKLDQIRKMAADWDLTLFGGDLFQSPRQPLSYLSQVSDILVKWPCPLFGVLGNHDYRGNPTRRESATCVVRASMLIRPFRLVSVSLKVGRRKARPVIDIHGQDYQQNPELPSVVSDDRLTALVSHQYYGRDKESFCGEDVHGSQFNYIFLGHDHVPYFPTLLNGTVVVRPGAICRYTKAEADREKVAAAILSIPLEEGTEATISEASLEVLPHTQVFSADRIVREALSTKIEKFVRNMRVVVDSDDMEILEVLRDLAPDETIYENCREYLQREGVTA